MTIDLDWLSRSAGLPEVLTRSCTPACCGSEGLAVLSRLGVLTQTQRSKVSWLRSRLHPVTQQTAHDFLSSLSAALPVYS